MRVSREQVRYYVKGLVLFKTTRLRFAILKAPTGKQQQTGLCRFLTLRVIRYGVWRSHAIGATGNGYYSIRTEISAYENHFAQHIQLVFSKNVSNEAHFLC